MFLPGTAEATGRTELGSPERRNALACHQRQLGEIAIVRAGVDRSVEGLVALVIAHRVALMHEPAQFLMKTFEGTTLGRRHVAGRKPGAQRLQLGHRLEHVVELFRGRQRDDGAPMRPDLDQARGAELADGFANRRARHAEAPRQLLLVERPAGCEHARDDLVGELQAQTVCARRRRCPEAHAVTAVRRSR